MSGIDLVAERPVPGHPRAYEFPETIRTALSNGLRVVITPMPGRAYVERAGGCVIGRGTRSAEQALQQAGLGGRGERGGESHHLGGHACLVIGRR